MTAQLTVTEDGSHTLFIPALNEHYHSTHGAVQESQHVFIESGLKAVQVTNRALRIFEMGFGTGLNALLTALAANTAIEYVSVEKYPVDATAIAGLNYGSVLNSPEAASLFAKLHTCEWENPVPLNAKFTLQKHAVDLRNFTPIGLFDVVYFDAFAPATQPHLWTEEVFCKLFAALQPGGILVTYCAQGQMKRNLKAAGFTIERLPGPPGKREITRATKPPA